MAKVTIIIEDVVDNAGETNVDVQFELEPAISVNEKPTPAQGMAVKVLHFMEHISKKVVVKSVEEVEGV